MWNTVLFVVVFSVCWRMTAGNVFGMCENRTIFNTYVLLNRNDKQSTTKCWCQIKSATEGQAKVKFNIFSFIGQQYKLSVSYGQSTSYFLNRMSPEIFYDISGSGEIKLNLEEQTCSVKNGLEFGININSTPGGINITCQNPTVSTPELCTQDTSELTTTSKITTSPVTTTSTSPVTTTTTSTVTTTSTARNTTTSRTTSTLAIAPTGTYTSVEISSTTNSQNEQTTNSTSTDDLVLIGGLVGGAVLLIILLLILIICLVRRKRRNKDGYDRPLSQTRIPPESGYDGVEIGHQNTNSSPVGMVIEDNPVYHSSDNDDSVSPRFIDTNQKSDDPIEMEIIDNDLYVSSDDVMNLNQTPKVEYAVVNKKRNSDKPSKETSEDSGVSISSNEPDSDHDRKFVLGPQGDEYTLVTKT